MAIYGRDAQGRFISKSRAEEQRALVERTAPTAKIVRFRERIRNTRIARTIRRAYSPEKPDSELIGELNSQYDNGGNYVIKIEVIGMGFLKPGEEFIISTEGPGSGDFS
jgi:hypothetical protein